jgi:hypothetical protein
VRAAFYGSCSDEDVAFARGQLGAEPLKPLATPLRITESGFGRVPRVYIETTLDRTLTLAAQRRMQAALPCERVHTLATDHSPFFSLPGELARVLGGL